MRLCELIILVLRKSNKLKKTDSYKQRQDIIALKAGFSTLQLPAYNIIKSMATDFDRFVIHRSDYIEDTKNNNKLLIKNNKFLINNKETAFTKNDVDAIKATALGIMIVKENFKQKELISDYL